MIDKRLKYLKNKAPKGEFLAYINAEEAAMLKRAGGSGKKVNGIPSFRPQDMGNEANQAASANNPGIGGGGAGRTDGGDHSKDPRTVTVTSPRLNPETGEKIPDYKMTTTYTPKSKIGFGPKGKDTFHQAQIKNMKQSLREVNPGFFDSGLGKIIKTIGLGVVAPQLLAGTKLGTLYSGYNKAKQVAALAKSFNITDKNVVTSLSDTVKDKFAGFNTTGTKGPKDPPREGGDGDNQQNALMSEYILLLQRMEQGMLSAEEQGRFNSLKSRLGKARGGRMNDEARKESQVKQFTPPKETGILQKLFGIDTDKLYDQGFESMDKYRERNPDNPREVLQTAGGKLSNLRHGVSTSLLRDAILKKINPGSYEMKEAPPSMNFKELKMSEEGPNKSAKGVASLLAYLGAGSNEIGTDFFSQETMEDLTANLLGLMKTDVYDTPEDKAAMLNKILENDTGGINTYLQSLAPKEKYQEDASLFSPMRQDKMRDQDLLFMKAEEDYEDKVKNLGLGAMDG